MAPIRKRYEQDQKEIVGLLKRFQEAKEISRRAVRRKEVRRVFTELQAKLERLILLEEEILFPHFDDTNGLTDEGPTAVMRVEHRQIRRLLEEIGEKLWCNDFNTDAEQVVLREMLSTHQHLERTLVYPSIDDFLEHDFSFREPSRFV